MASERRSREEHQDDAASWSAAATAIQVGATALLGGGFYFGFLRQQRLAKREKLVPKKKKNAKAAQPVIRQATMLERWLRLDRAQSPGVAAFKALLGGTIISVSGCALLVCGVAALLGVQNTTEFRDRIDGMLPRKAPPRLLPSEKREAVTTFASEEEELNHIAAIFQEAVEEEVRQQKKR